MTTLAWIVTGGVLMGAIALTGSVTLLLQPATLQRILGPLVSLAAGTLLGGAFFHLLPAGAGLGPYAVAVWTLSGFTAFLALEQFLHWHRCRHASRDERTPATFLILVGDGLHNFLGGLAIGSTFLVNPAAGISAWLAAAAHEVPQELGDFGVLVHGGWNRRAALVWNFISGSTFLVGALAAYATASRIDVTPLVLFGAGNFIYLGAADLVPEIKARPALGEGLASLVFFAAGVALMGGLVSLLAP
jgi:zinc and cadmium transporter